MMFIKQKFGVVLVVLIASFSDVFKVSQAQDIWETIDVITTRVIKSTATPSDLQSIINAVQQINSIQNKTHFEKSVCKSCEIVVDKIIDAGKRISDKQKFKIFIKTLCGLYTDWGNEACEGYVNIQIETILYILNNRPNLKASRFCGIYLQNFKCIDPDADKWDIPLPPKRENGRFANDFIQQNVTSPNLKILQLTDIHYDPEYQPGSPSYECGKPLCCHSIKTGNHSNQAGYWGDYHACDMPWHSVENLMRHVSEKHKNIDLIYFTGDIIAHTSWATDIESNSDSIRTILKLLATTFNKTIFPILGNHEPHPTDYYSPQNLSSTSIVSTQWLFDLVSKEWARWLPQDALETVKKGGFYTILVKPGFRIIALNSNVCFTSNLWLIYDDKDPYNQLKWLVNVLEEAEKNNENVHILSHIPPGDSQCHREWSHQFTRIVNRFSKTIAAQFNGHTHSDELRLFYNINQDNANNNLKKNNKNTRINNDDVPINVAFNAGSFTTFVGMNPNYRIYEVDDMSQMVLNFDQYTYNLTLANQNPNQSPKWFKLYSFKEAYKMDDLSLKEFGKLYGTMKGDNGMAFIEQYYKFMSRNSDAVTEKCGEKCRKYLICTIEAVDTNDSLNC